MSLFYRVKEIESSDFQAAIDIYEESFPDLVKLLLERHSKLGKYE